MLNDVIYQAVGLGLVALIVVPIATRKRLPGGAHVSARQFDALVAEYRQLELQYNLVAQATGNPPYWVDPAAKGGTGDPMMQLAALQVDAAEKQRRALAAGRGDFGAGFLSGYTTGRM